MVVPFGECPKGANDTVHTDCCDGWQSARIGGPLEESRRTGGATVKRALDIALGGVLTILLSPLVVILALGAALSLRTWPFFAQRRVGRNGKEFWVIKIRTLPRATAAYANKYDIAEVETSRFCAGLRRLHL